MCDKPNRIIIETERFDPLIYTVRAEYPDQVVVIVRSLDGGGDDVYGGPDGYEIEPLAVLPVGRALAGMGDLAVEFEVMSDG